MSFTPWLAVDLSGGQAVRLWQGNRSLLRVVAKDPAALLVQWVEEGARHFHLVDLDAAWGRGDQRALVRRLLAHLPGVAQVGGGVRQEKDYWELREAGAARVVVGTLAVERPELVEKLVGREPDHVVVAADCWAKAVVVRGWEQGTGLPVEAFARSMAARGVRHLLVTAVERDGTKKGPDVALLERLLAAFGPGVVASGGVGSLEHVQQLLPLAKKGLSGLVVGSALVDGCFGVKELLALVGEQ